MKHVAALLAVSALVAASLVGITVEAQSKVSAIPSLSGTYNGRQCVPANSDVCPEMNVKGGQRLLTARGKALAAAFDEVAAPKYDCSPATFPIIFGDPYAVQIVQQADRVTFAYEKDDVVRTIWLEGHGHTAPRSGLLFTHGYSTGRYEAAELTQAGDALSWIEG